MLCYVMVPLLPPAWSTSDISQQGSSKGDRGEVVDEEGPAAVVTYWCEYDCATTRVSRLIRIPDWAEPGATANPIVSPTEMPGV
jgi:hypothetical protein